MLKRICEVITIIKKKGYKAYLVGGSSRDLLLNKDFHDIDIATSAPLNVIASLFEVLNDDGKSMGSIKISFKKLIIDITRFRKEEYLNNSTFPKIKEYINDPSEDATRRDFTINSIYLDPTTNQIIDPYDGLKDLMSFKVKMINDPVVRIKEDPTRILRGIRIAYKLNFEIEENTKKAFIENISELNRISSSRYKKEINKFYEDLSEFKVQKIFTEFNIKGKEE